MLALLQHLGDGEQAHQHGEQLEALLHLGLAEGGDHAVGVVDGELIHQGDERAHQTDPDTPEHLALGQSGDNGQGEEDDQEFFNGGKLDGPAGENRSEDSQHSQRDHAAHEGGGDADFHGSLGLAPLRHRRAVKGGTQRGGGTGNVNEDGRNQTAGDAAHIQAQQQVQGHFHVVGVGQGQEGGHCHSGSHAGDSAEDDADGDTEGGDQNMGNSKCKGHFQSPAFLNTG